jgi:hypothetical protein
LACSRSVAGFTKVMVESFDCLQLFFFFCFDRAWQTACFSVAVSSFHVILNATGKWPIFPGCLNKYHHYIMGWNSRLIFLIMDFFLLHFHLTDLDRMLDVGLIGDICHNRFRVGAEGRLKLLH